MDFQKQRDVGPRFANPNSFEHEFGTRWKQLAELYKQKEEALKREMKLEEEKLEAQMEYARYEHETEMLRERNYYLHFKQINNLINILFLELRQREMDRERQKMEWEMKERQAEEQRLREEDIFRRQTEDLNMRMHHQDEEMRRRQQDNSSFIQVWFL